VTVVWQDIIAFRTANSVTVILGERHLISVTRYVTGVCLVSFINCGNYNRVNVQHLQKYLTW
jgi:hypothetical protein